MAARWLLFYLNLGSILLPFAFMVDLLVVSLKNITFQLRQSSSAQPKIYVL